MAAGQPEQAGPDQSAAAQPGPSVRAGPAAPVDSTGPGRGHRVLRWQGRRRRPTPYLVLSGLAVLGAVALSLRRPWGADFGLHVATVGRLVDDLWHPGNPMVESAANGPYVTPYTLVLALVARVTGAPAAVVLSAAAPVNLALLLYGLRRFVGLFTADPWAPVLALFFVPLLWGTAVLSWSGFPTLRGLVLILPYPSTLGLALLLLGWVALARAAAGPTPGRWILVGLLGGLLVLVHPFTALGAALGSLALVVGRLVRTPYRRAGDGTVLAELRGLSLALALAVLVVLVWPYFRVTDLLTRAGDLDPIHRPLYLDPLARYGFGFVVGLPALAVRLCRDRLDPLVLLFGLAGLPVLLGGLTGGYALGRLWPVVLVSLQVAAAVELVRALRRAKAAPGLRVRTVVTGLWAGAAALAVLAGLALQYGNLLLVLPRDQLTSARRAAYRISPPPDRAWVAREVPPGAVLLTADPAVGRDLLRYRIRAVAPPWPDPLLPDQARRRADQAALLDPSTPVPRRTALLAGYGVDWVLEPAGGFPWLDRYATRVVPGPGGLRLVRLTPG
ncbi:hypothetical protein [Plantactinospora sonchi]|uniref:Glycosyltransferase RgtA/B/C/D-like domain-containing protein n=1 Tax=Plantactinospora sonchi TaxID=1544735 RepID=A0ABU7S557_9ACTN